MTDAEKKLIKAALEYERVNSRHGVGLAGGLVCVAAREVLEERAPKWPTEPGLYWATAKFCNSTTPGAGRRIVMVGYREETSSRNVIVPDGTSAGQNCVTSYDFDRDEDGNFVRVTDPKDES